MGLPSLCSIGEVADDYDPTLGMGGENSLGVGHATHAGMPKERPRSLSPYSFWPCETDTESSSRVITAGPPRGLMPGGPPSTFGCNSYQCQGSKVEEGKATMWRHRMDCSV